jgi:hypothetical protein
MRKKFSIAEGRQLLEEYENGKSALAIASDTSSDTRTINKVLDMARHERDARTVRLELIKDALRKHHDELRNELSQIVDLLHINKLDPGPLSWYRGENSIFIPAGNASESKYSLGLYRGAGRPMAGSITIRDLLRQHLKSEPVWKQLVQADKAYSIHMTRLEALQRKVKTVLEQRTGYKMSDQNAPPPPFLYSYIAGLEMYKALLGVVIDNRSNLAFKKEIVADTRDGMVKFRNSMMVVGVSGQEEKCRDDIIKAFDDLLISPEFKNVRKAFQSTSQLAVAAEQAAQEFLLLGYFPGSCNICRRLGM